MAPKLLALLAAVLASAGASLEDDHEEAPDLLQFGSAQDEVFELLDEPRPIEEFQLLDDPIHPMLLQELHEASDLEDLEDGESEPGEETSAGAEGEEDLELFQQTHGRRRQSTHGHELSASAQKSYYHRVKNTMLTLQSMNMSLHFLEATINETARIVETQVAAEEAPIIAPVETAGLMEISDAKILESETSSRRRHHASKTDSVQSKVDELKAILDAEHQHLLRCDQLNRWTRDKLADPAVPPLSDTDASLLGAEKKVLATHAPSQGDDPTDHLRDALNKIDEGMNDLSDEIEGLAENADETRGMVLAQVPLSASMRRFAR